jgi:hypothetical protein
MSLSTATRSRPDGHVEGCLANKSRRSSSSSASSSFPTAPTHGHVSSAPIESLPLELVAAALCFLHGIEMAQFDQAVPCGDGSDSKGRLGRLSFPGILRLVARQRAASMGVPMPRLRSAAPALAQQHCFRPRNWPEAVKRMELGVLQFYLHQATNVIAAGDTHSMVCEQKSGSVYSWGLGCDGKLGHGSFNSLARPRPIGALGGVRVMAVACGPQVRIILSLPSPLCVTPLTRALTR